jgi:hypothetical protein
VLRLIGISNPSTGIQVLILLGRRRWTADCRGLIPLGIVVVRSPVGLGSRAWESICGALYGETLPLDDVGVDHRGSDVGVAEEFLDGTDVGTGLEEVGREGMPEGVAAGLLRDAGDEDGLFDRALQDGFVKMMAAVLTRAVVGVEARGGEDPLPEPLAAGAGVFLDERVGERHVAGALGKVSLVLDTDAFEVVGEVAVNEIGEEGDSVFAALAGSDDELVRVEVDVLHPEVGAFEQAQAGAIEQGCHEPGDAIELVEQRFDFARVEDDGESDGLLRADEIVEFARVDLQHVTIEKEQGGEGLILGRRADLELGRKRREKRGDLACAHFFGRAFVMEEDESHDPGPIGFLGSWAQVTETYRSLITLAELGAEAGTGFSRTQWIVEYADVPEFRPVRIVAPSRGEWERDDSEDSAAGAGKCDRPIFTQSGVRNFTPPRRVDRPCARRD